MNEIDLAQLAETRVQLHYAIQFMAATGAALAEPQPDYSHTSLNWNSELKIFTSALIQANQPFRVALDPFNLISMILDEQDQSITAYSLAQKTLAEGMKWLKGEIAKLGAEADKVMFLTYPPDDFPDHAIAHGATFSSKQDLLVDTLASFYSGTHTLLQIITPNGASPVRIWPHHFDMATLITLPDTRDGESLTIGVGMSPGDTNYNQPYWYVSPYPYPNINDLPELEGGGNWHTSHWIGGVLTASQLIDTSNIESSQPQIQSFLNSAIKTSQQLLAKPT